MSRPPTIPPSRRERRAQARVERPAPARKKVVRRAAARPPWQSPVVLTTVGAIVLGAVVIVAAGGFKLGPSALIPPDTSYAGLALDDESVGSPTAPVVMEVFADFQCPACKLFYTTELPSLLRDLVQPGFLRIKSEDIDIIDRGGSTESLELAAGAFCASDQGKYWAYHDYVFWNQGRENKGDHDAAFIDRVAEAAGLDMTAFHACQARADIRQPIIDRTTQAGAAGVSATPTVRLNGQMPFGSGMPSYDQLKAVILQLAASASPTPQPSGSAGASAAPTTTIPTPSPSAS